ncbi:MAG: condensation domain-containing protein [Clostridiales bacterium]|jgi:NRPS condensation-like uncharacterized protein|nr:condensation domain-containing protein [Clostridiales bacterium]
MTNKAEPYDIWFYLTYLWKEINDPLIRCRIDFDGPVDEDALKRAVTLSLNTVPVIGCSFECHSRGPRWVNKNFTGEDIVRVIESGIDLESRVIQCFTVGITVETEPLLRIYILRRAGGDTLCAVISHIVCDGAGFKQYLYLLSDIYTELKNGREPPAQSYYRRGIKPLFAGVSLKEKIKIQRSRSYINAYSYSNMKYQRGVDFRDGGAEAYMLRRTLSKESFYRIKRFAKMRNATINDSLMALFARAFCKNTGAESIELPSTMDLRKFVPQGVKYGVSNYTSNCVCDISVQPNDTLGQTITRVSEQMRVHKSGKDILKSVLDWNLTVSLTPYRLLKRIYEDNTIHPIVSFTNFGIINSELLNFDNTAINSIYITVSIKPRPYLLLSASTFNDACTLSSNIYGSRNDKIFIDKLFDDICSEISSLTDY